MYSEALINLSFPWQNVSYILGLHFLKKEKSIDSKIIVRSSKIQECSFKIILEKRLHANLEKNLGFHFVSLLQSWLSSYSFLLYSWHFVGGSCLEMLISESLQHFLSAYWRCSESAYIFLLIPLINWMILCYWTTQFTCAKTNIFWQLLSTIHITGILFLNVINI